jgi:cardiolipin synthase
LQINHLRFVGPHYYLHFWDLCSHFVSLVTSASASSDTTSCDVADSALRSALKLWEVSVTCVIRKIMNGSDFGSIRRPADWRDPVEFVHPIEAAFVPGNQLELLRDGSRTLPAMFSAIRGARRHVHMEYYVLEDVYCNDHALSDLLIETCARGVQIAIIFDAIGSGATPSPFFDVLRRAGIHLLRFNPLSPLSARGRWLPNTRDHRKLLIVDGEIAFVGGVNLSAAYERRRVDLKSLHPGHDPRQWRDTDLRVTGPAVARLQRRFLEHWRRQRGVPLPDAEFFPQLRALGSERVAIIDSIAGNGPSSYHHALLHTIRGAQARIWITAAYFLPTPAQVAALIDASRRGVDVRLLLPAHNDSVAALAVQRYSYRPLLEGGVKIYELQDMMLHSKSVIIDADWCTVGSSNFDSRSLRRNDEIDAIIVGKPTADALADMFCHDLQHAQLIDIRQWEDRPWAQKSKELFWKLWEAFL